MTNLESLACEMKREAENFPITRQRMVEGLAGTAFPSQLRRRIDIEGQLYQLQFTHDELSDEKELIHLSFSRDDKQIPDENIRELLRRTFFTGQGNVITFPGPLGSHIIHIAYIREKS